MEERQAGRHSSGQCTDVYLAGSFQFRLSHLSFGSSADHPILYTCEQSTIYVNESPLLCIYLLVWIMVDLVRLYKHIYDIAWWCNIFFSPPPLPSSRIYRSPRLHSKLCPVFFSFSECFFFPLPPAVADFLLEDYLLFWGGSSCCKLHDDICAKVVMLFLCYFWPLPFGHIHILTLHADTLTVDRRIGRGVCERATGINKRIVHI